MLFLCIKNESTGLAEHELDHTGKESDVYPLIAGCMKRKKGGIKARCGERLF